MADLKGEAGVGVAGLAAGIVGAAPGTVEPNRGRCSAGLAAAPAEVCALPLFGVAPSGLLGNNVGG